MCWSVSATVAMMALGAAAIVVTVKRRDPPAVPLTLGYFTLMEGLQLAGYAVLDACGNPVNQVVALLSFLHIAFQPLFVNAFALELVPVADKARARPWVYGACALSAVVMLLQLYPFGWAGSCSLGTALCGPVLCTFTGVWHLAWAVPYNGLMVPIEALLGTWFGMPTYAIVFFLLPLAYGAWRFVLFQFVAGPVLAGLITLDSNEMPAIWCLFSVGLILVSLSPWFRAGVSRSGGWGRAAA